VRKRCTGTFCGIALAVSVVVAATCSFAEPRAGESVAAERALDPASVYQLDSHWKSADSAQLELRDLRGKLRVLAIFYSSCEYACPIIIGRMKTVQSMLSSDSRERTGFVLITMDPKVDTPEKLRDYRKRLELEGDWTLLQGEDDAIRELAAVLGFRYRREADGSYSHSNMIFVLDEEGRIVHRSTGTEPGVEDIAGAVKDALR
jgi:protein SCO1/2